MKKLLFLVLVILYSCSDDEVENPDPMPDPMEKMGVPVHGDYTGTWNDNLYTDFPISTRLDDRGNDMYGGPFFYSQQGAFIPCCMDTDDNGNISFEVSGDSILKFRYNQQLEFFQGGCPGLYQGSGTIDTINGIINIDFTGEDCEGMHTGGRMYLQRR